MIYLRDERLHGGARPRVAVLAHLAAKSYAGFNGLYEARRAGSALAEVDSR